MIKTTITAHAGCLNSKVDSIESVALGIEIGADYCEVDVNSLENGVGVLKHDEIRNEDEDFVTLEEVFTLILDKDIKLNLDIKNKRALPYIEKLGEELNILPKLLLSGVDEHDTLNLKNSGYKIKYLMNVEYVGMLDNSELIEKYINYAKKSNAIGLNVDYRYCTKELIEEAHKNNLIISLWTIDDKETIEKFIALGVDNITTNRPEIILS
ncbi:MAG: glycerophosphodiester phosphodiesterase [Clostridium sp.]